MLMPSTTVYKISDKLCATCSYWSGAREIQFVNLKPHYIKTASGLQSCLAQNVKKTAGSTCLKWRMWEKID